MSGKQIAATSLTLKERKTKQTRMEIITLEMCKREKKERE
jgi:hypothetical protein